MSGPSALPRAIVSSVDTKPNYDLFLGCSGYEPRCVSVSRRFVRAEQVQRGLAVALAPVDLDLSGAEEAEHSRVLNLALYKRWGFQCADVADSVDEIEQLVTARAGQSLHIGIDASSMPRAVFANMLRACRGANATVDVFYQPSGFLADELREPEQGASALVSLTSLAAVRASAESRSWVAAVGLGTLWGQSIAAAELMEAPQTLLLRPVRRDTEFDGTVETGNELLMSLFGRDASMGYPVRDLYGTVLALDDVRRRYGKVVVVALGPKALAIAGMALAEIYPEDVGVLGVSRGLASKALLRESDGEAVGLRISWPTSRF